MKTRVAALILVGISVALTGCHRQQVVLAAPAPPPPPPVETVAVPPPSHPTEPAPDLMTVVPPMPVVVPPPKPAPPVRRRQTPVAAVPAPVAAAPPPIALGELTTGGETNSSSFRQGTEDLLKAQGQRLLAIPPARVASNSRIIEQARLFLRQANDAWGKQDVEGAHTLAVKARVLLDEMAE